jgi:small subunit ribosomal protein S1
MSWTRNVKHPSKLVNIGDEIEAVVLKVDRDDEKISLGMKQIEEDPWLALPEKYPIGTRVEGKVRNLTSFGAFVEIEPGIDGLIHISDMSWTKRVQHPSEVLRKSDDVSVLVLGVDPENKRISLGLKQTQEDPWDDLAAQYAQGVEKSGSVVRLVEDGVVVDLGDDVEGFIPRSHLDIPANQDMAYYLRDGMPVDVRVIEFDGPNRRIVLTATSQLERLPGEPPSVAAASASDEAGDDAGNDAGNDAGDDAGDDAGNDAGNEAAAGGAAQVSSEAAAAPERVPAAEAEDEAAGEGTGEAAGEQSDEAAGEQSDEAAGEPTGEEAAASGGDTATADAPAEGTEEVLPVSDDEPESKEQA